MVFSLLCYRFYCVVVIVKVWFGWLVKWVLKCFKIVLMDLVWMFWCLVLIYFLLLVLGCLSMVVVV